MSICNECLIETDDDSNRNYTSPSPDEIALCTFAKYLGLELMARKSSIVTLDHFGQPVQIEVTVNFEFDSERKMQSVIIKHEDQYFLLIKGADSAIFNVLDQDKPQPYLDQTKSFLYNASIQGLRTLCFGIKA
jgi:phospholipid-transporting ATPase